MCPVEEIGKNSVNPWIIPIIMASSIKRNIEILLYKSYFGRAFEVNIEKV